MALRGALIVAKGEYDWATQVDIQRLVASTWLAYAEGRPAETGGQTARRHYDESLRLMLAAADLDDATEKHSVTPGAILPAREQLGELLLELKQPLAALQEFETSLRRAPNRFNSLYGAARAARLAGNQKSARTYYRKLLTNCRRADTVRPEINEAKAFLARVNTKDSASPK